MSKENAVKVLKEVQHARNTLEKNIFEVNRKHEQMGLFSYLDGHDKLGNEENVVCRIKRQVNDKIKEINDEVKNEVYNNKKAGFGQEAKTTTTTDKNKRYGIRYSQLNKKPTQTVINNKPKVTNTKLTKTKAKTPKTQRKTKDLVREPPPNSSTAYDELVLQHLYGRQPHQALRHTINKDQSKSCLQHKFNTSRNYQTPIQTSVIPRSKIPVEVNIQPKNDYCIHLQTHDTQNSVSNIFPVATALSEPSRDPSGRLPLPTVSKQTPNKLESEKIVIKQNKKLSKAAGPNVAVINIKADDDIPALENKKQSRIRDKIRDRYRKSKLNVQPLPNVDIDTTDPSFSSTDSSQSSFTGATKSKVIESPDVSNAYDFQEFISIKDLSKKDVDVSQSDVDLEESLQQPQISLFGCKASLDNEYHGPSFPPKHVPECFVEEKVVKINPTLEKSAQDWLEKELLARLITQMVDQQNVNPSSYEHAINAETVSSDLEESQQSSYTWIEHVIGLQGIQFFVDAGIPVNEDLIRSLLKSVIVEYLETLFGHPPPLKSRSPQPLSVVEKEEEIQVSTPVVTPLPSPVTSEKKQFLVTPNQTVSDLSEQVLNENIDEEMVDDIVDDIVEEYEIVKTPDLSIVEVENYHVLENIGTPDITIIEDASRSVFHDIQTPHSEITATELPQYLIADFEHTEKIDSTLPSPVAEEGNVSVSEICVTPLPVILSVKSSPSTKSPSTKSPSIPSTTVTMSSSTTVGLSTFEEISSGEFLNPESVVSEASEGELKLLGHFNSRNFVDESMNDSHVTKSNTKRHLFPPLPPRTIEKQQLHLHRSKSRNSTYLSEGEINQTSFRPLKSIGEVSDSFINQSQQTDVDMDDFDDDHDEDDPMAKILHKINSPPGSKSFGEIIDRSEGEITPHSLNIERKQSMIDEKEESLHEQSFSEIVSKTSFYNSDILNEENDAIFPSKDVSNSNQEPILSNSRVITVQPRHNPDVEKDGDVQSEEDRHMASNDESNTDFSKSEGEDLQEDLSAFSEEEKEKVIMVLRLPDMEDDQLLSDDEEDDDDDEELTTDGISSISGL